MNYPQYNQPSHYHPQYNNYPVYRPVVQPMTKEELERKELHKTMNGIGVLLIVAVSVFFIFSIIFSLIYALFVAEYTFPEAFDTVAENLLGGVSNIIPIGACGFFFLLTRKPKVSEILLFNKVGFKKLISVVSIGFAVCMLSNLITSMFMDVSSSVGLDFDISYEETAISNSPIEIIIYLISVAVVPTFSEEILFRGAILGTLRKYGDGFAVMVSAFFFGIFHGNMVQFPFAFIVGLVQGWAFVYTNSLLPAMLIHFMNNGFSVISDVIYTNFESRGIDTTGVDILTYGLVIALCAVAIVSAAYISKRDKNFLSLKKYGGCLHKSEIKKAFIQSPTVIVAVVLLGLETLFTHLTLLLV